MTPLSSLLREAGEGFRHGTLPERDDPLVALLLTNLPRLVAACALAEAVDAYEDAHECCDCDPSDWRCGHAVGAKSKKMEAALSAFRASPEPAGEEGK